MTESAKTDVIEGHGETILFVDDEVKQLRLMQHFLEESGYHVFTAKDGAEAVALHARHKDEIALVVLDLALPNMSGSEALQAMQRTTPGIKAIVATGYMTPQAESSEWRAVIMKPYRLDDILEKISAVLAQP
jgi:CheY-like chemotaxis protein